jgi:hypothetical protein
MISRRIYGIEFSSFPQPCSMILFCLEGCGKDENFTFS